MWELTRLWNARRVFETLRNVTPTLQRLYNYPRLVPNSALRGEPWTGIPAEFDDHIVGIVQRRATGWRATGRLPLVTWRRRPPSPVRPAAPAAPAASASASRAIRAS
ncbi:hypothetical protein THER5_1916 [Bifidobacterium thermacidophilum subsp. thermacidophilum]|uniref:Uncharacterized protein n=1 Tax=Bifidobacterium thermacidophilum subsp. thermacidophilum TaxID=79262 RepID=A0A087E2V3_9BIFI|nr:hypothetical protein THER5_1916 [Bifidobacterium thermacidophilum subsp. thermacidophilum]